ncbi:hypothetical protein Scep_022561 [Stephania cephalantha]|uniref:Uncharacterized protein n=1 Tax=Stephania cephalantha TaxID=152367 RepID=A0AAP0I125_9MAGN
MLVAGCKINLLLELVGKGSGVKKNKGKTIVTTQEDLYEETNVNASNTFLLEDYECDGTTFDDILFDVPVFTYDDDDDEELQEARKKVRESRNKNKKKKKTKNDNGQDRQCVLGDGEEIHDERGESRVEGGELQVYGGELVGDEIDECESDEGDEDSEEAANDYLVGELVSDDEVVGAMSDYQIGEYSDCNESEYFESDDMGSYCSEIGSEDENRFVRRKNRRLRFDTNSIFRFLFGNDFHLYG